MTIEELARDIALMFVVALLALAWTGYCILDAFNYIRERLPSREADNG
jgi:hypothetical protein